MEQIAGVPSKVRTLETGGWVDTEFVLVKEGKCYAIYSLGNGRTEPRPEYLTCTAKTRKEADGLMDLLSMATTSGDPTAY